MSAPPLAILGTGLVCSVGQSAAAACAAMRAGVSNPTRTRYKTADDKWLNAHSVTLEQPVLGRSKLTQMAALAIRECGNECGIEMGSSIPLLLCVAEHARPGRMEELDDELFEDIRAELAVTFSTRSKIVPHGRASVGVALTHARRMIYESGDQYVLIAGTDSLLSSRTLGAYERETRLLNSVNSNGFMPGEAAACILVGRPRGGAELLCNGIGTAIEPAHIASGEPLRGDGLTVALRQALEEAEADIHSCDLRIADLSGEHYYFKEAALAVGRLTRRRKPNYELWHPAEFIGEVGAAAGIVLLIVAEYARRKDYLDTSNIIAHAGTDGGSRIALILEARAA
jgi:3-oxoacyl-[acyl-carrier-protein] synthase I